MNARIYAAELDAAGMESALDELEIEDCFVILERIDDIEFPEKGTVPDFNMWERGWIFREDFELRWEGADSRLHAVLTISGNGSAPSPFGNPVEEMSKGERTKYYLWGEDSRMLERRMEYRSLPSGGRAMMSVEEFRDESDRLVYYRFVGMEREAGKGE